ncbi:MAG: hypothetical protein ABIU77_20470 [Ferruginibacter sp.]
MRNKNAVISPDQIKRTKKLSNGVELWRAELLGKELKSSNYIVAFAGTY